MDIELNFPIPHKFIFIIKKEGKINVFKLKISYFINNKRINFNKLGCKTFILKRCINKDPNL